MFCVGKGVEKGLLDYVAMRRGTDGGLGLERSSLRIPRHGYGHVPVKTCFLSDPNFDFHSFSDVRVFDKSSESQGIPG